MASKDDDNDEIKDRNFEIWTIDPLGSFENFYIGLKVNQIFWETL